MLQYVTKYKSNNGGFSAENQCVSATFLQAENLLYIFSVKAFIQSRYPQAENQPHILALSVFADTQSQR